MRYLIINPVLILIITLLLTLTLVSGCTTTPATHAIQSQATSPAITTSTSTATTGIPGTTQAYTTPTSTYDQNLPTGLLQPSDLTYMGAFRLPDGPWGYEYGWGWSGGAMAYYPGGDPDGPEDGYPGSIFGTGHNWNTYVSEFAIPEPAISSSKEVNELNTATTLQGFADIRDDMYSGYREIPRVGLEYLPAQGDQTSDKLYFCWAPHLDEGNTGPTHGWCDIDLSSPQSTGTWGIDNRWNYVTSDYIFQIPPAWADAYTPGILLATGRFRDGGQGSMGPSLFAYGPWNDGNPPADGAQLDATELLLYSSFYDGGQYTLNGYHHSDEWSGASWLTAGDKSAVIFVGTKGQGECWYGDSNGPCMECAGERGWWSVAPLLDKEYRRFKD